MATSLLLEGEDLEALLVRAHAEGGSNARILRAEKVRRGGFLGFFARQAFEVAVEIPDPQPQSSPETGARPVSTAALDRAGAAIAEREADGTVPPPAALAAEGVAGAADRANAAARTAARTLTLPPDRRAPSAATALLDRYEADGGLPGTVPVESAVDAPVPSTAGTPFSSLMDQLRQDLDLSPWPGDGGSPGGADDTDPEGGDTGTAGSAGARFRPLIPSPRTPGPLGHGSPGDGSADHPATAVAPTGPGTSPDRVGPASRPSATDPGGGPAGSGHDAQAPEPPAAGSTGRTATGRSPAEIRLAADRKVLRSLGVPSAWTRRMRAGDRYTTIYRMLSRLPQPTVDPEAPVVAVIGPADTVLLEAYRTAVDLAIGWQPRPVVYVPATDGPERFAALADVHAFDSVVVAVETGGYDDAELVRATLRQIRAQVVIAVLDATLGLTANVGWLEALGRVDAVAVDGATHVVDPARCLQLTVPVVRLDGIPIDRVTWTALLCAQLEAAEHARAAEQRARSVGARAGATVH